MKQPAGIGEKCKLTEVDTACQKTPNVKRGIYEGSRKEATPPFIYNRDPARPIGPFIAVGLGNFDKKGAMPQNRYATDSSAREGFAFFKEQVQNSRPKHVPF